MRDERKQDHDDEHTIDRDRVRPSDGGPTCPVERAGHPCPRAAVSATVQAKTANGQIVSSTLTDKDGGYRFQLRPGTYELVVVTPKSWPHCSPVIVKVSADHTTHAAMSCDTGIR